MATLAYYLFLLSFGGLFVALVGCVIIGALLLGGWE